MTTPTSSVIIATMNRPEMALRLLENIAQQTVQPDEVIIVEVGRRPWTATEIPAAIAAITKVIQPQKTSLTQSRHAGLSEAKHDLLFFFDDDIILPTNYIELACHYMAEHPAINGIGGRYTDNTTQDRRNWTILIGRALGIYANGQANRILPSAWADYVRGPAAERTSTAQWLFGCNAVFRKSIFTNADIRFENEMCTWSFLEDAFIGARITARFGPSLCVLPALQVVHAPISSHGSISKATLRMRIIHRYIFWRDHIRSRHIISLPCFGLGMVANLLLMFKQERKKWIIVETVRAWLFVWRNWRMNWEQANEFIFAQD